jgi:hypothetical protein
VEVNVTAGPFKSWKYYLKGNVVKVEVNATCRATYSAGSFLRVLLSDVQGSAQSLYMLINITAYFL